MQKKRARFRKGIAIATALAAVACGSKESTPEKTVKADVTVDLYVMSKCPHSAAARPALIDAVARFKGRASLKIDYVGLHLQKSDVMFKSLNGSDEVEGDMIELCAEKHAPAVYFAFLKCMDRDVKTVPGRWKNCAAEVGADEGDIADCRHGEEGALLLAKSFARSKKAQPIATPWVSINGQLYMGARTQKAFVRAICRAFAKDTRPSLCNDMPAPPTIEVTVITDKRCTKCPTDIVIRNLKISIPSLTVKTLDWSDPQAQRMCQEAGVSKLPAFLFDKAALEQPELQEMLAPRTQVSGNYLRLIAPSSFDPLHPEESENAEAGHQH